MSKSISRDFITKTYVPLIQYFMRHFSKIWKTSLAKIFLLVILTLLTACSNNKGEKIFLKFNSYSSPRQGLRRYKNAVFTEAQDGLALISIDRFALDSFEVDLTLLYRNNNLGGIFVEVSDGYAEKFASKYSTVPTTNIDYAREIGPCTNSTDIDHKPTTTCFKWVDKRILFKE